MPFVFFVHVIHKSRYVCSVTTVLLVQADASAAIRWRAELSSRGFQVICAAGVQSGIRRVRHGDIDAILVDDADVSALVDELELLPDSPPFVWLSSSPAAPRRSVEVGAAAFFAKPCDDDDVQAIVERLAMFREPARLS